MILKFNENWSSHKDTKDISKEQEDDFIIYGGESLESVLKKAKKLSIEKNKVINFLFNNKQFSISKYSDINDILKNETPIKQEFFLNPQLLLINPEDNIEIVLKRAKKIVEKYKRPIEFRFKGDKFLVKIDTNIEELTKNYLNFKNKQKYSLGEIVYIKPSKRNKLPININKTGYFIIVEYDENRTFNYKLTSKNNFDIWVQEDWITKTPEEIKFSEGYEVVGLPSGQIIYMTDKQMSYFKTRHVINYIKTWKKPVSGGYIPIKIEKYCFEDVNYKKIIDMIDTIQW